jgi:hypothetical protein
VAWPTLLMPVEYALITQFCAFTFLYYEDTRATNKGLAPHWYAMYRFVLTFIVGASIVVSLIGRGEVADAEAHRIPSAVDRVKVLRDDAQEVFSKEEAGILAQKEANATPKDNDSKDDDTKDDAKDDEQDDPADNDSKTDDSKDKDSKE